MTVTSAKGLYAAFSRVLPWARVLRPALMLVVTIAVLGLGGLALELRSQLRSFQEEPVDNIHWNITQLELDIVRFESEANLLAQQPRASLKDLRTRFDLFYSRVQSMQHGRMFAQLGLTSIVTPMNERLQRFLDVTTPQIDGNDDALRASLPQLRRNTAALHEDLRTMTVELIDGYAAIEDQRRAGFAALLQRVAWGSAALLAMLILLLALILWLNHKADRNMQQTRRVSSRLGATVDTSLDAIIVAGQDGRIIDYNAAAATIFGYSRDEAEGAPLGELIVPPHLRAAHDQGMDRMNRTGEMRLVNTGRFQITAMRKGGQEFPVELALASIKDDGERLIISFLRDISDRVASEQAVIAARDKALAAEQAKTNFMAVMSHEMRTPLNGVMAALEIAARQTVDDKQARFLGLARSAAVQLLRHVNEVLDISKIDAGRLELTEEDFDPADLVETLAGTLEHLAARKNTRIKVLALTPLPTLHGDSFRLGQILQNFLSNAIKFTENGLITVEYESQNRGIDGVTVEMRVIDSGIGIAEADQARVFEDFVMIDPSYGRSAGGTGLGLAISRRLAHAMGGEIGVKSEYGHGSCFWLRIPFRFGTAPPAAEIAPQIASSPQLNVLVVEDNATNRMVLDEMLLHLGHRVTQAHDGAEGMAVARDRQFDVILMDVSMPVMDGLTATKLIREQGQSKSARIIAVTAHSMAEDRDRFQAAGMDGHLTKPISGRALAQVIAGTIPAATASAPDDQLVSTGRLAELVDTIGRPALTGVLDQFRHDMPILMSRLIETAEADSLPSLRKLAHEGSGSCGMVGAVALGQHLAQIERACLSGDLARAQDLAPHSMALWQSTLAALPREA